MRDTSWPLAGLEALEGRQEQAREQRLSRLVDEHFDFVWRLLRRVGLSPPDADDAAQQVFMIATRKLEQIEPGSERTFVYGTALRVASNARRGSRRRREVSGDPDASPSSRRSPEANTELARAVDLLDRVLAELPSELRRVLVLAEVEQLEVAEIARLERLKLGTAASRLRRARDAFRKALDELGAENPFTEGSE